MNIQRHIEGPTCVRSGNHFSSGSSAGCAKDGVGPFVACLEIMSTETLAHRQASQSRSQGMSPTIRRIQCEYEEMPGLKLTEAQARRLWALDDDTCRLVLATLLERRFLRRTPTGMYVRAS
jgi:hypothetical protein